jgi:chromate transporter
MWPLVLYFLRLGSVGFGGPIVLASAMERDLVAERGWFTPEDYRRGLTLAQLAPGPLAAQLAIYLGWARAGVLGATLVSIAFVLPSFLMVVAIAALYVRFGALSWIAGAFYGIAPAVIAIIARSAYHLTARTLRRDVLMWILFAINAVATVVLQAEVLWLVLASGAIVMVARRPPKLHTAAVAVPLLLKIALYFSKVGAFVFGSGLAIVPFLHSGVVEELHWLTERQFVDAVAVAMITPGPVVITVAFIGYLVAGPAGALVAAVAVFLPCYLLVVIPAPFYTRVAGSERLRAFVDGATAAAVGAISGAAVVMARRAVVDLPTIAICIAALAVLTLWKRVPEPVVVVAAALAGIVATGM